VRARARSSSRTYPRGRSDGGLDWRLAHRGAWPMESSISRTLRTAPLALAAAAAAVPSVPAPPGPPSPWPPALVKDDAGLAGERARLLRPRSPSPGGRIHRGNKIRSWNNLGLMKAIVEVTTPAQEEHCWKAIAVPKSNDKGRTKESPAAHSLQMKRFLFRQKLPVAVATQCSK